MDVVVGGGSGVSGAKNREEEEEEEEEWYDWGRELSRLTHSFPGSHFDVLNFNVCLHAYLYLLPPAPMPHLLPRHSYRVQAGVPLFLSSSLSNFQFPFAIIPETQKSAAVLIYRGCRLLPRF